MPFSPLSAVEIGCGYGRLLWPLSKVFRQVEGLDISPKMLEKAEDYLQGMAATHLLQAPSYSWPLEDCSKDLVYSIICFQHIPTQEMIARHLAEAYRVLKPGGHIRIQTVKGLPSQGSFQGFFGHMYLCLEDFQSEFTRLGFLLQASQEYEPFSWLLVTARKPCL